ncbi:MAG: hypothetical protein IGBAC_1602 [Ignavibacteriae bacterium]|nr:MAG: hypothetical protein IGBAC_1602 [Ignavibacteriota bacterium]
MEFLQNNSLYIVLIITIICWLGIFIYLLNLDKKIKKLEKDIKNN